MTLLSVDDNPRVRAIISKYFSKDFDVFIEASDGADATEIYRLYRPCIVLMDIEMKNVDGFTATKNILAIDPEAKIIIMTSHDNESYRQAAIKAGAIAFFCKDDLVGLKDFLSKGTV